MGRDGPVAARVIVAGVAGMTVTVASGTLSSWRLAPALGWTVAGLIYAIWTILAVGRMSPVRTGEHATREDPTVGVTDVIVLLASIASLGGVVDLLTASSSGSPALGASISIASVVTSWIVVHTVFMLRYARLYYGDVPGGIDFNQKERPAYVDFAYLAFTLGMTYQVSDTDLQTRLIRATVLRHALVSYLLGAVILATTINLIASLGS